ncbi:MAG: methyltransferase [Candidatus Atribacteria bacterium]|nr:methyltransferase [Candidatus Atribacteria bacterium]
MTPRERVMMSLRHEEPDILPLDLGSTLVTGIHVAILHKLKVALGLAKKEEPVKVIDPYQMLGEVDEPLRRVLGIDTIPLMSPKNFFGFKNENWKPWVFFDGTPLLVPEKFNTVPDAEGNIYQYPEGDQNCAPSAKLPKGGFYHDALIRQKPIDEATLTVEDQIEEFGILTEEELKYYENESRRLFEETDYAIVHGGVPGTNLGDIAFVPGLALKEPRGIRDVEEWYVSLVTRQSFLREVFARMTEIGLTNLKLFHQAVGERIQVLVISGTDFGSQNGPFISRELYRTLFKPFHQKINRWIHENTSWKTFIHTCGSIYDLLPDFHEAGFDILNPVQISASKMDPETLKKEFGNAFTFWGGGVNTQDTLPFKSPEEVKEEVRTLIRTWKKGGGFVFATVHNIQSGIPVENLLALFEAVNEFR